MSLTAIYGDDPYQMTAALLCAIDGAKDIPPGALVAIKPDTEAGTPPEEGADTHPQMAAAVADYLRENGITRLFLADSAPGRGLFTLAEQKKIPFYDLREDGFVTRTAAGIPMELSKRMLGADYIINLPVLKGHRQMAVACALYNLLGCASPATRRQLRAMGEWQKNMEALAALLPPQLVVVDGLCGDPFCPEGGNPLWAGRIFAGQNPTEADAYGAVLLGFGTEKPPAELHYNNTPAPQTATPRPTRRVRELERHLCADAACPACHAAALCALARLEEQGELSRLGEKLSIGQGWRGQSQNRAGLGDCCRGFACWVPGCPPTALDILNALG